MPGTDAASTTGRHPVTGLTDEQRAAFVRRALGQIHSVELDTETALLMFDALGLTPSREHVADALAAKYFIDGLRDGTISPADVDPRITVHYDVAREQLAQQYEHTYDESVRALATIRKDVAA